MHLIVRLVLLCALLPVSLWAQSSGFRAQGRYYSAKEAYDAKCFSEAAQMCRESRDLLGGKSNVRLQFLMVSALFNAGKYREAQKEVELFFKMTEAKGEERAKVYQNYPQDVDQLTSDETREISIMIDKVDREVNNGTEAKNDAAAQAAAKEVRRREAFEALRSVILTKFISKYSRLPGPTGFSDTEATVTVTGSYQAMTITFKSVMYSNISPNRRKPHLQVDESSTIDLSRVTSYSFPPSGQVLQERIPVNRSGAFVYLQLSYQAPGHHTDKMFDTETFQLVQSNNWDMNGSTHGFTVSSQAELEAAIKKVKAAQ